MQTVSGFPYFEVQFTKDGKVFDPAEEAALCDYLKAPNASDLIVISHGWNNAIADARTLYEQLLKCLRTVVDANAVPTLKDRSCAVLAILWPSMKFADDSVVAGGAAAIGGPVTAAVVNRQIDALEAAIKTPAAGKVLKQARALVPALENDAKAREKFADLIRSVVPAKNAEVEDASKAFFARDGGELMDRLSKPLTLPAAPSSRGGAASLGVATGGAAGMGDAFSGVLAGARNLLNYTTYYLMKERAGTVGRSGVNGVLRDVKKLRPDLRLHLVGHSFGGRLVTAAADGPDGQPIVSIDTMTLLQAAFSHNGFAVKFDGTHDGSFRAVVAAHKVRGPILISHSKFDTAVGREYPLASRVAGQDAAELGDANDRFGGMGSNGAQHTPEASEGPLRAVGGAYTFEAGKVYNLNADAIIKEHSDICHDEVAYAVLKGIAAS
jgi:hypothetical protein